jgi:hypothetical protein
MVLEGISRPKPPKIAAQQIIKTPSEKGGGGSVSFFGGIWQGRVGLQASIHERFKVGFPYL